MEICDLLKIGPNPLLAKLCAVKNKRKRKPTKKTTKPTVAYKTNDLIL